MGRGGKERGGEELLYGRARPIRTRSSIFFLEVDIGVTDPDALSEALREYGLLPGNRGIADLFFSGDRVRVGTRVIEAQVLSSEGSLYRLGARIDVLDPDILVSETKMSYAECFFDDAWEPDDLADAVGESYTGSSLLPSPAQLGLELRKWAARQVR